MKTIDKKVKMSLIGIDSNAFSIIGAFSRNAKKQGWTSEEIAKVNDEATGGNYDNLIRVYMSYCED